MAKNEELRIAWEFVENTGRSIFLTGKAGTGKTTFLKTVVSRSRKRSIVVAPTGVAAVNAGGVTIHSFFQLPLAPFVPDARIRNKFDFSHDKRRIMASLDLLIIDEISMVRSDLLDAIDHVLRRYRNRLLPFGGVQLLMIGDLQQLTPVVTPEEEHLLQPYYDTPYFFGSKALAQTDYVTIQLEKVYRQQDDTFIQLLNHVRSGKVTMEDLGLLNTRYVPGFVPRPDDGFIRLTTHNRLADQNNECELARLTTPQYVFKAKVEGTFPYYAYPTSDTLVLKVGTQVMFVKNDPSGDHRYYNGKIGLVTELGPQRIIVKCPSDENTIEVEPLTWENTKYTLNAETREIETEVQGKFVQYPLRLAWSITIHKSQGLTFDHAIIDAGLSFAPGQVYVALSRCRTLQGMVLSSPIPPRAIMSDTKVEDYISHQGENAQQSIARLPLLKEDYYRHLLLELFDFQELKNLQKQMVLAFIEYYSRSHPDLETLQRQTLQDLRIRVMDVAAKWRMVIQQADINVLHEDGFLQRVRKSADYFDHTLEEVMAKPIRLAGDVKTGNNQATKRMAHLLPDIRQKYVSSRLMLHNITQMGFSVDIYLKQKQLAMLDAMDLEKGGKASWQKAKTKEKKNTTKPPKEKTWVVTMNLFKDGLTPEQIAKERGMARSTIIGHLARYLETGEITIDQLVHPDHQKAIRRVVELVGTADGMTPIKALCPPEVTYEEIRLVMNARKQDAASSSSS